MTAWATAFACPFSSYGRSPKSLLPCPHIPPGGGGGGAIERNANFDLDVVSVASTEDPSPWSTLPE